VDVFVFCYFWKTNFSPSITQITGVPYYYRADLMEIAFYSILLFALSKMYGGTRIGYLQNSEVIFSQAFATLAANALLYAELSIMAKTLFMPKMFLVMTLAQIVFTLVWSNVSFHIYKSIFPPRKMLLVHGYRPIQGILNKFASRKDKYNITKCMNIKEGMSAILTEIQRGYDADEYQAVVIWDVSNDDRNQILKYCYATYACIYHAKGNRCYSTRRGRTSLI